MSTLFGLIAFLSVIALVLGLIKPSLVIRWGDPEKRTRGKVLKTYLITLFVSACLAGGLSNSSSPSSKPDASSSSQQATSSSSSASSSSSSSEKKQAKEEKPKWNTSDPEAKSNGNAQIAAKELKKIDDMQAVAQQVDPAELMKRPWDFYGQVVAYSGRISDISDNPPGSPESKMFGGDTYTVVVMGDHDSTVQAIMAGKSGTLQKNQQVTIYGLPVGTIKLHNRMGGTSNDVLMIGK